MYIVEFHADGGQMCISGRRVFVQKYEADRFAEAMRSEPGHSCGPESVTQYESAEPLSIEGDLYPTIANLGR